MNDDTAMGERFAEHDDHSETLMGEALEGEQGEAVETAPIQKKKNKLDLKLIGGGVFVAAIFGYGAMTVFHKPNEQRQDSESAIAQQMPASVRVQPIIAAAPVAPFAPVASAVSANEFANGMAATPVVALAASMPAGFTPTPIVATAPPMTAPVLAQAIQPVAQQANPSMKTASATPVLLPPTAATPVVVSASPSHGNASTLTDSQASHLISELDASKATISTLNERLALLESRFAGMNATTESGGAKSPETVRAEPLKRASKQRQAAQAAHVAQRSDEAVASAEVAAAPKKDVKVASIKKAAKEEQKAEEKHGDEVKHAPVRADFRIYAMRDGQVWVQDNKTHETLPTAVGAMLPDGSKVLKVDEENEAIATTAGDIHYMQMTH